MRARVPCPHCGQMMPDPEQMTPAELKAIRGMIGARLGYGGPMPQGKFANLVMIGARSLWNYERGLSRIPGHVGRAARQLRDHPPQWAQLSKEWKRQLDDKLRRKAAYRRRKEARERQQPEGPEPPF